MRLPVFVIVGEALDFGGRRLETSLRVSWLPLLLLFLLNYMMAYVVVSVIAGHMITPETLSPARAALAIEKLGQRGFAQHPFQMLGAYAAWGLLGLILISSLMAPLVRDAALGEHPPKHAAQIHFGPDAFRFLVATVLSISVIGVAVYLPAFFAQGFIQSYADRVLAPNVSFPDTQSLHYFEMTPSPAEAHSWIYERALPLIVSASFLIAYVYLNLRLSAYPGFVAAQKSLSPAPAWRATRGLNVLRILFALTILVSLVLLVQFVLNAYAFPLILKVMSALLALSERVQRMFDVDGEAARWLLPMFQWIWLIVRAGLNLVFLAFQYGVIAGFFGAVYKRAVA